MAKKPTTYFYRAVTVRRLRALVASGLFRVAGSKPWNLEEVVGPPGLLRGGPWARENFPGF